MAKQIIIKTNCIVLQETKDNNIVSAQGFNKGGLSYRIDNNCIKFYLVDDYFYKNVVWTAGFPLQVGDAYYTAETIADALKDLFIRPIETLTVDTQLDSGSTNPVTNSATAQAIDEINEKFPDYYLKTEVDALLDTKADASSIPTDYYDRDQTDALLANKADKSEIPSLNGYATVQWVNNQHYLTQHQSLAGLASEDWVLAKHYLQEHQSLEDYYDKDQVITLLSTKMDKSALDEYATKEWVDEQGYLKHHQQIKRLNGQSMTGSGDVIIDAQTLGVYTSGQTSAFLATKADKSELNDYALKTDLDNKLDVSALTEYWTSGETQDAITAAVSGKASEQYVDSAVSGKMDVSGMTGYTTKQYVDDGLAGKADRTDLTDFYTKNQVDFALSGKQDTLSAGTGIEITDNVISVTLDTNLFIVVQELPQVGVENKIYLVPSENTGVSNVYVEYIYTDGEWEELGEAQVDVDLSDYYKKNEVNALLNDKLDASAITEYWTSAQTNAAITSATQNLASEQYVDGAVSGKMDTSGMTVYALKSEIPVVPTNVSAFNNDAGYLTSHTPLKTVNNNVISGTGNVVIDAASLGVYTSGQTDTLLASKLNVSDIDDELSSTSENPVQNKVIYAAIGNVEALLATI